MFKEVAVARGTLFIYLHIRNAALKNLFLPPCNHWLLLHSEQNITDKAGEWRKKKPNGYLAAESVL